MGTSDRYEGGDSEARPTALDRRGPEANRQQPAAGRLHSSASAIQGVRLAAGFHSNPASRGGDLPNRCRSSLRSQHGSPRSSVSPAVLAIPTAAAAGARAATPVAARASLLNACADGTAACVEEQQHA